MYFSSLNLFILKLNIRIDREFSWSNLEIKQNLIKLKIY